MWCLPAQKLLLLAVGPPCRCEKQKDRSAAFIEPSRHKYISYLIQGAHAAVSRGLKPSAAVSRPTACNPSPPLPPNTVVLSAQSYQTKMGGKEDVVFLEPKYLASQGSTADPQQYDALERDFREVRSRLSPELRAPSAAHVLMASRQRQVF